MGEPAKLRIDRTAAPGLTMLALHGVVDASFEGAKVAATVKTTKLVLNLREVRRFASWGMAEWMSFLRATAECDLYFVECSTYAIQQMNLVTGLLGHGKLISFYTPFRCSSCGEEADALVVVAEGPEKMESLADSARPCATCGGTARIGKYQGDVLAAISSRATYDIDPDVAGFLRAQLKYLIPTNRSLFRALQRRQGKYTYLRLTGNIATLPSDQLARAVEHTTVLDLSQITYEPGRLEPFRAFLKNAAANVDTLQLLDCPAGFFEQAVSTSDLDGKVKIRSFAQEYHCPKCSAVTTLMIDVAQNLEGLTSGALPAARCSACKFEMPPPTTQAPLQRLPARERDLELDRLIGKAKGEPDDKLDNALAARAKAKAATTATARSVFIGSALAALVVGGLVLAVVFLWKKDPPPAPVEPVAADKPAFQRPDWILSDTPSSAFCQDMIGRLMCVGVSSYTTDRDVGVLAANDAALDELVNMIGIKVVDPWFRENVLPGYSAARTKSLAAMQNIGPRADDQSVRTARHRVAQLLLASGGPAVPAQRSDWYWEEYDKGSASGTEFLVFIRYDIPVESMTSLIERYSTTTQIHGGAIMTAFPGMAWQYADFAGGAVLTKVASPLTAAGATPLQVIVAVDEQPVSDASVVANRLKAKAAGSESVLTARLGDGAPVKISLKP